MAKWADAIPTADIPDAGHICVDVQGEPIVLCRVHGELRAFANMCPHAGMPIGEGELRGAVMTCPFHGYAYNVRNGRNIDWPHDELPLRMYPVRTEDDMIQIDLQRGKPGQADDDRNDDDDGDRPTSAPDPGECEPTPTPDDPRQDPTKPDCPEGYPEPKPTDQP